MRTSISLWTSSACGTRCTLWSLRTGRTFQILKSKGEGWGSSCTAFGDADRRRADIGIHCSSSSNVWCCSCSSCGSSIALGALRALGSGCPLLGHGVGGGRRVVGVREHRAGPQELAGGHRGDGRGPRARGDGGAGRGRLIGDRGGLDAVAGGPGGALRPRGPLGAGGTRRAGGAGRSLRTGRTRGAGVAGDADGGAGDGGAVPLGLHGALPDVAALRRRRGGVGPRAAGELGLGGGQVELEPRRGHRVGLGGVGLGHLEPDGPGGLGDLALGGQRLPRGLVHVALGDLGAYGVGSLGQGGLGGVGLARVALGEVGLLDRGFEAVHGLLGAARGRDGGVGGLLRRGHGGAHAVHGDGQLGDLGGGLVRLGRGLGDPGGQAVRGLLDRGRLGHGGVGGLGHLGDLGADGRGRLGQLGLCGERGAGLGGDVALLHLGADGVGGPGDLRLGGQGGPGGPVHVAGGHGGEDGALGLVDGLRHLDLGGHRGGQRPHLGPDLGHGGLGGGGHLVALGQRRVGGGTCGVGRRLGVGGGLGGTLGLGLRGDEVRAHRLHLLAGCVEGGTDGVHDSRNVVHGAVEVRHLALDLLGALLEEAQAVGGVGHPEAVHVGLAALELDVGPVSGLCADGSGLHGQEGRHVVSVDDHLHQALLGVDRLDRGPDSAVGVTAARRCEGVDEGVGEV